MKIILPLTAFLLLGCTVFSQVGIGTADPKAQLDITAGTTASEKDGLLIPRVSEFPTGVSADQDGMMVFVTGTGAPVKGFYYWDNTIATWNAIEGASVTDSDWFAEGTTTAPNAITDDIFTQGNVAIGKNTADYPLDIELNGTRANPILTKLVDNSTGTGDHTGIQQTMSGAHNETTKGIETYITNTGTGLHTAIITSVQNGGGNQIGIRGTVNGSSGNNTLYSGSIFNSGTASTNTQTGLDVSIAQPSSQISYGLFSSLNASGATASGIKYGFYNLIAGGTGAHYGIYNDIRGTESNTKYGTYNLFGIGTTNTGGILYGTYNSFGNSITSTTDKYGTFTRIPTGLAGTHYGIYSDVQNATGYAGYFLGRLSLGDGAGNRYTMPAADGTAGQVMSTDGAGNIAFTNASADADWHEVGGSSNPDNINDNIFTQGFVAIGSNNPLNGQLEITGSYATRYTNIYSRFTGNGTAGTATGISNNLNITGSAFVYGTVNRIEGNSSGLTMGFRNDFLNTGSSWRLGLANYFSNTGSPSRVEGLYNDFTIAGASTIRGVNNLTYAAIPTNAEVIGLRNIFAHGGTGNTYGAYTDVTGTGTGLKYGYFAQISSTSPGTHYGVYANVQNATGYAGYFLGRLSLGDGTSNRYTMPAADGNAGEVITANGDGTTAWEVPSIPFIMSNPKFPDGFSNITPITHVFTSGNYTVPAGKNLYITVYRSGFTNATLAIGGTIIATGRETSSNSFNISNPILAGPTEVISSSETSVIINGFLVDANITPITSGANPSYTVPANKILVVLSFSNTVTSGTALFTLNGTNIYSGNGNSNSTAGQNSLSGPFLFNEADVLGSTNGNFNGYLIDN